MRKDIKASVQKRLSRIEGQVRGLSKMVDEDRYCIDIVTQIAAVRAALRRVEEEVLRDHVAHCVEHAIASGDKADQRQKITERWKSLEGRIAEPKSSSFRSEDHSDSQPRHSHAPDGVNKLMGGFTS
jgi:CsoR family transcriptional regulator, copper-sensing transcriptional repressor